MLFSIFSSINKHKFLGSLAISSKEKDLVFSRRFKMMYHQTFQHRAKISSLKKTSIFLLFLCGVLQYFVFLFILSVYSVIFCKFNCKFGSGIFNLLKTVKFIWIFFIFTYKNCQVWIQTWSLITIR
jgi:hypothetical protein